MTWTPQRIAIAKIVGVLWALQIFGACCFNAGMAVGGSAKGGPVEIRSVRVETVYEKVPNWSVFFSPNGGCQDAIISEINRAKKEIKIQAYSFTCEKISESVCRAAGRGVSVCIVIDSGAPGGMDCAKRIINAGGKCLIDAKHKIAHNKIILIDGKTVITGSYNFSASAEHDNAENVIIIRDKELSAVYGREFDKHLAHAEKLK